MSILNWSDDYSANINEIDEQHKGFIKLINDFHDSLQDNIDHEAMPFLLNELVDYTKTHFAAEEALMKKHQYPEYEEHKAEHDSFANVILDILKDYEAGDKNAVDQMSLLLSSWLSEHIVTIDKKYVGHLNSKGVY